MPSRAADVIAWIEKHLRYPSGGAAGEPVVLLPHERRFIEETFAPGVSEAVISMPRGNSKTGLCAYLGAAAIVPDGPLLQPGADVAIVAASIQQGSLTFRDILGHAEGINPEWAKPRTGVLRTTDSIMQCSIKNRDTMTTLRVLSGNPKMAHGLRLSLALLDEPAQWETAQARDQKMYIAITTSAGKIPGCRVIVLGTRPDRPDHFLEELLADDDTPSICLSAPADTPDDRLGDESVWGPVNPLAYVNPALLAKIRKEAGKLTSEKARAAFRAMRLNMGTPGVTAGRRLVTDGEWSEVQRGGSGRTGGFVLGVDLGSRSALSAVAAAWGGGGIDVMGLLGSRAEAIPVEDERLSRSASPVPSVEELLFAVRARWGDPVQVVADNYRSDELATSCQAFGWPLELRHTPEAAHAALVAWDATLADLILPDSPLLDWCVAGARVVKSSAGLKLARDTEGGRSSAHRDDPVAALIPAVAARVRLLSEPGPVTTVRML